MPNASGHRMPSHSRRRRSPAGAVRVQKDDGRRAADEAGIGKGAVYLHFPSKEEAVLSHVNRLCGRLDTIAAGVGPVDPDVS
jgi:hypothetical protein